MAKQFPSIPFTADGPMVKKLFLVHIPKTGGTSVNQMLEPLMPSITHLEGKTRLHGHLRSGIKAQFVSGHLPAPTVLGLIRREEWFVFAFLRNPVQHLISHLKWCARIGRSWKVYAYPTTIADVCRALARTDLSDVGALERILERPQARRFFDNCQTRYLSGYLGDQLLGPDSVRIAKKAALELDFIGFSENLDDGMQAMAQLAGLPSIGTAPKSNRSRSTDRPDFTKKEVLDFYRKTVWADAELYVSVKSRLRTREGAV